MGIQAGAKMSKNCIVVVGLLFLILALPGLGQTVVRVGALPNVTHAHAMVGKAIEALFPRAIDMSYVGSNPAITGYVRSNGEVLRVGAGAASGSVALVVRSDSGGQKPKGFHHKRVASPRLGDTQESGDVQVISLTKPDHHFFTTLCWPRLSVANSVV
jgi:hypothetical protein